MRKFATSILLIALYSIDVLALPTPLSLNQAFDSTEIPKDEIQSLYGGDSSQVYFWISLTKPPNAYKFIKTEELAKRHKDYYLNKDKIIEKYQKMAENDISINDYLQKFVAKNPSLQRYLPAYKGYLKDGDHIYILVFERQVTSFNDFMRTFWFRELKPSRRFELYMGLMRGVHLLHVMGINHCDITPANVMMSGEPTNNNMDVKIRISDFGRSRQNKACEIRSGYYVDEVLEHNPKKITGIDFSKPDLVQVNFLDIYSIAATIVSMESQMHLDSDEYTLLMAIKVMRMFAESQIHEKYRKTMHRMVDLLSNMLGIGRKIPSLENAMYELEEIIYTSWTIESKSDSELNEVSPKYVNTSSWLSELAKAAKNNGISYKPDLKTITRPKEVFDKINVSTATTSRNTSLQSTDLQTIKEEIAKNLKPTEMKTPEAHQKPMILGHKIINDHFGSSNSDIKKIEPDSKDSKIVTVFEERMRRI